MHAVAKQMQEQQLRARQLVLQQQAASAVAAASKTQREVRSSPCSCPHACMHMRVGDPVRSELLTRNRLRPSMSSHGVIAVPAASRELAKRPVCLCACAAGAVSLCAGTAHVSGCDLSVASTHCA